VQETVLSIAIRFLSLKSIGEKQSRALYFAAGCCFWAGCDPTGPSEGQKPEAILKSI